MNRRIRSGQTRKRVRRNRKRRKGVAKKVEDENKGKKRH